MEIPPIPPGSKFFEKGPNGKYYFVVNSPFGFPRFTIPLFKAFYNQSQWRPIIAAIAIEEWRAWRNQNNGTAQCQMVNAEIDQWREWAKGN